MFSGLVVTIGSVIQILVKATGDVRESIQGYNCSCAMIKNQFFAHVENLFLYRDGDYKP